MTTVIINEKTKEGERLLEFLKTQKYVTISEVEPSSSVLKSMKEAKSGQVIRAKSTRDLLSKLKE